MKRLYICLLLLTQFVYASHQDNTTTQQLREYRSEVSGLRKIVTSPNDEGVSINNLQTVINHWLPTRKKECDAVTCKKRSDILHIDQEIAVLQQQLSNLNEQWTQRNNCSFQKSQAELTRYQKLPLALQWQEINLKKFPQSSNPENVIASLNMQMNVNAMREQYFFMPSKSEALALIQNDEVVTAKKIQQLVAYKRVEQSGLGEYQQYAHEYNALILPFTNLLNNESATKVQTMVRRFSAKSQLDRLKQEKTERLEQVAMATEEAYTQKNLDQEREQIKLSAQREQYRKNRADKKKNKKDQERKATQEKKEAEEKELEVENVAKVTRQKIKEDSLIEIRKKEQVIQELSRQEEIERQVESEEKAQQEREEFFLQKKRNKRQRANANKKIKSEEKKLQEEQDQSLLEAFSSGRSDYVVTEEDNSAAYRNFIVTMNDDLKQRGLYLKRIKEDTTLDMNQKRDALSSHDKKTTRYDVKSLLEEYIETICDDDVTQDDVSSFEQLFQHIIACHKELRLENESVSWYVSLYPGMHDQCNRRYEQLEQELQGYSLKDMEDLESNVDVACTNTEKSIEAYKLLLQSATKSKKKEDMRIWVEKIQHEESMLSHLELEYEANGSLICKKQIHNKMKLLQTTGGLFDMARFPSGLDIPVRQERVVPRNKLNAILFALEVEIKGIISSSEGVISDEESRMIYDSARSHLRELLVAIGFSERNCNNLIPEIMGSVQALSKAYSNDIIDIDNLEHYLYELFARYNKDGHNHSHAQANDVIRMHIVLIKSFARIFYKK